MFGRIMSKLLHWIGLIIVPSIDELCHLLHFDVDLNFDRLFFYFDLLVFVSQ